MDYKEGDLVEITAPLNNREEAEVLLTVQLLFFDTVDNAILCCVPNIEQYLELIGGTYDGLKTVGQMNCCIGWTDSSMTQEDFDTKLVPYKDLYSIWILDTTKIVRKVDSIPYTKEQLLKQLEDEI